MSDIIPTVFDSPKWKFRLPPMGVKKDVAGTHDIRITSARGRERNIRVVLPTEFYSFAREILKCPDVDSIGLYVDEVKVGKKSRWYLAVEPPTICKGLDLWYWTPSNKPKWI